jgi:hypothetical protein
MSKKIDNYKNYVKGIYIQMKIKIQNLISNYFGLTG